VRWREQPAAAVHRGDATLELRDPLVKEMQLVYWVVGVHRAPRTYIGACAW